MNIDDTHEEMDRIIHDFIDGNLIGFRDIKLDGNIFATDHRFAGYSALTIEAQGRIERYTLGQIRELQDSLIYLLVEVLDVEWSVQIKTTERYNKARRMKLPTTQITLRHSRELS